MNKSRSRFLSCHPLAILISIKHIPTNHCYATFFIPTFPIGALISMFASQMGWQGWIFFYHLSRGGIQTYVSRYAPTNDLYQLSYRATALCNNMIIKVSWIRLRGLPWESCHLPEVPGWRPGRRERLQRRRRWRCPWCASCRCDGTSNEDIVTVLM